MATKFQDGLSFYLVLLQFHCDNYFSCGIIPDLTVQKFYRKLLPKYSKSIFNFYRIQHNFSIFALYLNDDFKLHD